MAEVVVVEGAAGLSAVRSAAAAVGRVRGVELRVDAILVGGLAWGPVVDVDGRRRGAANSPDAALGGGQDLGHEQVRMRAHLGKLVALGLGHEVDRSELERLERDIGAFLGERADHDHGRLVGGQQERQRFQAGNLGHLDVERDHVGLEPDGLEDRFAAVARRAHDLDFR